MVFIFIALNVGNRIDKEEIMKVGMVEIKEDRLLELLDIENSYNSLRQAVYSTQDEMLIEFVDGLEG